MVDLTCLKMGDTVFWLDSDNDVIKHTYIGSIGNIAVLSGELMENKKAIGNFPIGRVPLIDSNIESKIIKIMKKNETYNPYPVSFVNPEYLYMSEYEAIKEAIKDL